MSERKVKIEGELTVDQNAIFANFQKDLSDTKDLMHAVVIILLVMVGGMIFSLQIALWQSMQSKKYNACFPYDQQQFP